MAMLGNKNKIWIGVTGVVLAGLGLWGIMLLVTSEQRNADMIVYMSGRYLGGREENMEYIRDEEMAEVIERTSLEDLEYNSADDCDEQYVVVEFPKKYGGRSFVPCRMEFPEEILRFLRGRGYKI